VVVDGIAGYIDTHCAGFSLVAEVANGSRAYALEVMADHPNMATFRDVLATVRLSPTGGATPTLAPTMPAQPATTLTTFTSPEYGYSIGLPSNWQARAATSKSDARAIPVPASTATDAFGAAGPGAGDPRLVIAAPDLPIGTSLDTWSADVNGLQATSSCDAPQTTVATTVAGASASLMTWLACPEFEMWAVFVRGTVGYEVVWIDQYATNDATQQAADRAAFLRVLATMTITGP
jgi:hypothetical protein